MLQVPLQCVKLEGFTLAFEKSLKLIVWDDGVLEIVVFYVLTDELCYIDARQAL